MRWGRFKSKNISALNTRTHTHLQVVADALLILAKLLGERGAIEREAHNVLDARLGKRLVRAQLDTGRLEAEKKGATGKQPRAGAHSKGQRKNTGSVVRT